MARDLLRSLVVLALAASGLAFNCYSPPSVMNTKPTTFPRPASGYWTAGTTVQAICNDGYMAAPLPRATCQPTGKWTYTPCATSSCSSSAGCVRSCAGLPYPVFGINWAAQISPGSVAINSYATATCTLPLYGKVSVYCGAAGFSTLLGACNPVGTCSEMPTVTAVNSDSAWRAACMGTAAGSSCQVVCNKGYTGAPTLSSPTLRCFYNGASPTRGTWAASITGACVHATATAAATATAVDEVTPTPVPEAPVPVPEVPAPVPEVPAPEAPAAGELPTIDEVP